MCDFFLISASQSRATFILGEIQISELGLSVVVSGHGELCMKPPRFMIFICEEQMMFCGQQALLAAFHKLFCRERPEKRWPRDGGDGGLGMCLNIWELPRVLGWSL